MQTRQKEKLLNSNRHYSLRKLSVGLASVLIGISFLNGTKTTVKADTIANNNDKYAEAHENNESNESIQAALLKNTDVAEGDSVHTQSDKNVDTAGILTGTSSVQSSSAAQNSNISTKTGEVSKAGNFEAAGDISSAQNSVAKPQQNNLLDDLDKQKTFVQSGDQAETKNQENRLADQTNYKLTNNGGADSKKDLEQNLTVPDETKQVSTTKSDADKSITQTSSDQHVNNQLNNRAEDNSQTQPQNSLKLAKRMLAVNLIETNALPTTNGGFDEATWGKLDVNNWQGSVQADDKPNALKQNLIAEKPESEIVVKTRNDIDPNKQSWLRWQFTDADDNNKAIAGATIITGNSGDTFTKDQITLPKGYEDRSNVLGKDAANLKLPAARTIMMYTIPLFHHHTDLTKQAPEDEVKQTRSITVHYKYLDGDKANQEAAPDAKLDVYYSRNKFKDDVTGKISYTNWSWDKSQGDPEHPGYHIVSGKWDNLPEQWDNVIANVPTIAGYTAVLDEPNRPDNVYHVNANTFVHPLWNNSFGSGTTDVNKDSLAYLATNTLYEAKNEHTVYYKANNQQNTIKFVDDDNKGAQVGKEQTIAGVTDQTVDLNLQIPKNYELAEGTKLPTSFKFAQSNTQTPIEIHLKHKRTAITDSSQLHATGTRTITIYLPHHDQPMIIVQTVGWQRTGDLDEVTNTPTYTDWKVDADASDVTVDDQHSTQYQAYVLKDGVVNYAPIKLPHVNGYKAKLIKDPVNPTAFLVSFMALPQQLQNNQSNNVQLPQKPTQPEQKQPEQKQPEQKPSQPIQARPADDKQVDQVINHISYVLMHNDSTFDNADSFEPAQNDSAPLEAPSDSTQKDDAAKPQKVNAAKHKKHIVNKHVIKRHKKHAKKYHLKRRSRKHTKRAKHAKTRIIKHRKRVSRKFRKYNLKHIKKSFKLYI